MVEFETLQSEEIKLPNGSLIVAATKAISENGETDFIAITKAVGGRFKQTVTIPMDKEIVNELARALQTVV